MRLPYIDETTVNRVNGILRRSGTTLKVAWTSGPTLGSRLINSALSKPPCPAGHKRCHTCENELKGKCSQKNVVYRIRLPANFVKQKDARNFTLERAPDPSDIGSTSILVTLVYARWTHL